MEEANTPIADLKREQSEPSAVTQNGLDDATTDALDQSEPGLDQGEHPPFSSSHVKMKY